MYWYDLLCSDKDENTINENIHIASTCIILSYVIIMHREPNFFRGSSYVYTQHVFKHAVITFITETNNIKWKI